MKKRNESLVSKDFLGTIGKKSAARVHSYSIHFRARFLPGHATESVPTFNSQVLRPDPDNSLNNTADNLKGTLKLPDMNLETAGPGYEFKRSFSAFRKTSASGKLSADFSIPVESELNPPRRKPSVTDPGTGAYLTPGSRIRNRFYPGSGIGFFPDPHNPY